MQRRMAELGITVMPYPPGSLEAVAARAVARVRPFTEDGRGYQDTLVWLSALAVVDEESVVLVSQDKEAFGKQELHLELQNEARAAIAAAAATRGEVTVTLVKTLPELVHQHVEPRLARLDQFAKDLQGGNAPLNLSAWLNSALSDIVHAAVKDGGLGVDVPQGELGPVTLTSFTVLRAHAVSDIDAYVTVEANVKWSVAGWRWFSMSGPDDWERDWVDEDIPLVVELELLITNQQDVVGFNVVSVSREA